ncbi:hypothetical protein BwSG20_78150 [Bradyrhizobium ottawaense]|nr:hypothetical protein BwSG20_78150 [Bradyrhizobium ottawaense]
MPRKVDFSCFGYHPALESRLTCQEQWVLASEENGRRVAKAAVLDIIFIMLRAGAPLIGCRSYAGTQVSGTGQTTAHFGASECPSHWVHWDGLIT